MSHRWGVPILLLAAIAIHGQDGPLDGGIAFDVASVKRNTGDFVPPSFPLSGDAYRDTGGYFRAGFTLAEYIAFAYKLWPAEQGEMLAYLPKWANTDEYLIEARAAGHPTKDQMRRMMQSLLAARFQLAVHFETRVLPVYLLTLVRPGKLGPKLIPHGEGPPCPDPADPATLSAPATRTPPFPPVCDAGPAVLRRFGGTLMQAGYRNVTMDTLTESLFVLDLGRPLVNKTGLDGRFDYTIEWAPDPNNPPPAGFPADAPTATSVQALRDQLGLKLEATSAPVQFLVIEKVERPSDN